MKVKDYIDTFALEYPHPYDDITLLKWVNLCESNVYGDTIKQYINKYYPRVINTFQFNLPSGVDFLNVKKLYVNGQKYKKKDIRAYKETHSFWYEDGKLCIYPACSVSDTSYVSDAGEITFATNSITTTGDDFTFSVGEVILVSGATTSGNNKAATIIGVAAKVLTFASGTFTAGADAAAVTITAPKIKMTYESVPSSKLIANITTDDLLIPDRFAEVYDYFIMSKIAYLARRFAEAQNHQAMFASRAADYSTWYESNRAMSPDDEFQGDDEMGNYNRSIDFDTEDYV